MPNTLRTRQQIAAELGRWGLADHDLASLLAQVVPAIGEQLQVELSSFLELLPDGRVMFQAGHGWRAGIVGNTALEMSGDTAAGNVIRTSQPQTISNWQAETRYTPSQLVREHQVASSLFVPLLGQIRPLGVLCAHSLRPRDFSTEDTAWLQVLANILSARLERERREPRENDPKLLRAEQMMAIGQVAAGVAHELRNPLTSIKGLVQVNLRELGTRGMPTDDLEVIEHEIRRMESTLQTFLDFARPPLPERRLQRIEPIVERVLALASGRARKQHVQLLFLRRGADAQADIDGAQIQQVLLNIVLNALDAMPQGGRVEVELGVPHDNVVEIHIRDTGPGIAAHILPKVFETFVSSKETGVGLGLPLSQRVAEEHGGSLTAYNLPIQGACFLLRLPVAAQEGSRPAVEN